MEAALEQIVGILERAATEYEQEEFRLGQMELLNDKLRHLVFNANNQLGLYFCSCLSQTLFWYSLVKVVF